MTAKDRPLDLRITDSPDIYKRVAAIVRELNTATAASVASPQSVVRAALRIGLTSLEKEAAR